MFMYRRRPAHGGTCGNTHCPINTPHEPMKVHHAVVGVCQVKGGKWRGRVVIFVYYGRSDTWVKKRKWKTVATEEEASEWVLRNRERVIRAENNRHLKLIMEGHDV